MTYPPNTSGRENTTLFNNLDHQSTGSKHSINKDEKNMVHQENSLSVSQQDYGPKAAMKRPVGRVSPVMSPTAWRQGTLSKFTGEGD